MKKVVGILIFMLLISTSFSISIASTFNGQPIKLRIEAQPIYDRIWIIKVYAINSYDRTVRAIWYGNRPCTVAIHYLVPNEDLKLITNHFYRRMISIRNIDKTFEPGEEKLVFISFFYGISNWIYRGFAEGLHPKNIKGFPILPEGEYEITAAMHYYRAIYDDFDGTHDGLDDWDYLTINYPI